MTELPLASRAKPTTSSFVSEGISHPQPKSPGISPILAWEVEPRVHHDANYKSILPTEQVWLQTFLTKLNECVLLEAIRRAAWSRELLKTHIKKF